jgi:hypothetical protein
MTSRIKDLEMKNKYPHKIYISENNGRDTVTIEWGQYLYATNQFYGWFVEVTDDHCEYREGGLWFEQKDPNDAKRLTLVATDSAFTLPSKIARLLELHNIEVPERFTK